MNLPQPLEFASYTSSVAGALMLLGSFILLYKGVITLSQKSKEEALTIEFKKQIKLTSHYPAVGLFLIGVFLIVAPMALNEYEGPTRVTVEGNVLISPASDISQVSMKVMGGPWSVDPGSDGSVGKDFYPDISSLSVEVYAPGRIPFKKTYRVGADGYLKLGDIRIADPVVRILTIPAGGE